MNYYNENDPKTTAWLRELIKAGLIADGEVDPRSIVDVQPGDLRGFVQCHFFAGIGGWSYALRLAGWDDSRAVWTGSCPCQPFSSAGAQAGGHDPRDLWPAWFELVKECRPPVVFGEQVEAAIGHGWLDRLCDDLEAEDYAIGACGLPAASVGAFHIRNRLWFVADTTGRTERRHRRDARSQTSARGDEARATDGHAVGSASGLGVLADSSSERRARERLRLRPEETGRHESAVLEAPRRGEVDELAHTTSRGQRIHGIASGNAGHVDERKSVEPMGHASHEGLEKRLRGAELERPGVSVERPSADFWSACDWLHCRDGKARPVEPGTFPLAHGLPARVGRLRGYGNAIVPPLAAEFIKAYREAIGEDLHGL